jgi:hypothetical protein
VGEAFDAVEIFDAAATPAPPPFPEVSGPDATLFLSFDNPGVDSDGVPNVKYRGVLLQIRFF